jgi:L-lactate dehydrogenase complex protein LldG
MPDSRDAMLRRIRTAIAAGNPEGTPASGNLTAQEDMRAAFAAIPRTYNRAGQLDREERLHLFTERLHDYDATVTSCGADSIPQAIAAILERNGQRRIVIADGLPGGILPTDFPFLSEREASLSDLDACDGIITTCTVAIATTGTIVLCHGPGEGARKLTVIPDRHLCIVRTDQLVETVPEAFDCLMPYVRNPMTFISGPSATADIEMTRIRGVHGPRFLDVVILR